VLLNEFVYRTDGQLAATGERQWIQATLKQLSDAMMGLYAASKVRDALTLLCERGLLKRQDGEIGDNAGALYAVRPNSLNKALDELEPPAESQGPPGKKDRGGRQKGQGSAQNTLSYPRARPEKEEEERKKEAAAGVSGRTGSSMAQLRAPAADPWKPAADTVRRFFPALATSAWRKCQDRAQERGYDADAIASATRRFGQETLFGASNPVVFVMKLCDRLDAEQASQEVRELAPRAVGKATVFKGYACLSCRLDLWWSEGGVGASCFECDPPRWNAGLMSQGRELADAAQQRRTDRGREREAENVEYQRQLEADAIASGLRPAAQALPRWCEAELTGSDGRHAAPPAVVEFPAAAAGAGP
jgi:hypothetical protein